jgi:hypothetical protein
MADSSTTTALAVFFFPDRKSLKRLGLSQASVNAKHIHGKCSPLRPINAKQIWARFPSAIRRSPDVD